MSWVNFRSNKQVTPGVFSRSSISKSTLLLETLEYSVIVDLVFAIKLPFYNSIYTRGHAQLMPNSQFPQSNHEKIAIPHIHDYYSVIVDLVFTTKLPFYNSINIRGHVQLMPNFGSKCSIRFLQTHFPLPLPRTNVNLLFTVNCVHGCRIFGDS